MTNFRLDRTAFKAQTVNEASDHGSYYRRLSWTERLAATNYLNSVAFNFDINDPPRLDRSKFSAKSLNG